MSWFDFDLLKLSACAVSLLDFLVVETDVFPEYVEKYNIESRYYDGTARLVLVPFNVEC